MIRFYKYCFLVFVVLFFSLAEGQTPTPKETYYGSEIIERKFDEEKWREITKDFDYSDALGRIDQVDDDSLYESSGQSRARNSDDDQGSGQNAALWASFFKILFIVLVIGVVALLLYNVLGAGDLFAPRSRKIQRTSSGYSIEDIEDNIHESDLERFIREALSDKDYALAIRGYYLAIIKELSLSKKIKWKRDKTNKDYLREMRQSNLFQLFREVTRVFEKVWYGEGELGEEEYLTLKPKFENLVRFAQSEGETSEPV